MGTGEKEPVFPMKMNKPVCWVERHEIKKTDVSQRRKTMRGRTIASGLFCLLAFNIAMNIARAEPISQSLTLKPGWNAVFLEVEPQSSAPEDVFAGISNLLSVWMWNPRTSTVEFIQDPDMLVPEQPQWMVYFPGNPVLTNLFSVHGETAYLINLGGTANVTWSVTGEPKVPKIDWKANSFNFVGFHLTPGQEPLFHDFFSSSPSHAGQEIYALDNATAKWVKVTDPTRQMKRGEGFWVYCVGHSEYVGPLSVQLEQGTGLHYGTALVEQDVQVLNNSFRDKTVSLSISSAATNLHYWLFDPENNVAEWIAFPPGDLTIGAGEKQKLRLGVRRAGLSAGTVYEANVTVSDGEGMDIVLPVSVTGISYAGLWVGDATIRKVSEPANVSDPSTPVKTGSEFSFRLIVHEDETGKAHLLREVVQLWQEGTWKPDPNNLGKLIPDQPGYFVLIANDALIPNYSGAALRDGQPVGRRVSSPAFGFVGPKLMSGSFQINNSLSITLVLAPDDPTNPFRHTYHPDHKLPEQSYEVTRVIKMSFQDEDGEGKPITGVPILSWGSSDVGGIYSETIWGLHKDEIHVEGTFVLHKVSNVAQLLF
jgi:hypothetical protein